MSMFLLDSSKSLLDSCWEIYAVCFTIGENCLQLGPVKNWESPNLGGKSEVFATYNLKNCDGLWLSMALYWVHGCDFTRQGVT